MKAKVSRPTKKIGGGNSKIPRSKTFDQVHQNATIKTSVFKPAPFELAATKFDKVLDDKVLDVSTFERNKAVTG